MDLPGTRRTTAEGDMQSTRRRGLSRWEGRASARGRRMQCGASDKYGEGRGEAEQGQRLVNEKLYLSLQEEEVLAPAWQAEQAPVI